MDEDGVTLEDAFEVLESFLQRCISEVQADSTQAMRHGQYGAAREGLAKLDSLISLLERTNALEQEFVQLVPPQPEQGERLGKGKRTPQEAYYAPILKTLVEMGGSGAVVPVLERVYEKMQHLFNEYDLEMLPSQTDYRWRNAAMWARFELVNSDLLCHDSPRGVWEISEAGRRWLEEQEG